MAVRSGQAPLAALLLGLVFAAGVYGMRVLDPTSHAWLLHGDPAQHYIGAVYFLSEPWQWPPGAMQGFGAAGASVMLTDSLPLLALPAKALGMPAHWQYFGAWLYACHALAAYAGARLLLQLGCRPGQAVLGALFFTAAPVLLMRAYGHEALQGQFLLLAGLALAFGPWRGGAWLALIVVSVLVHPYLAVMVFALAAAAAGAAWTTRQAGGGRLTACAALASLAAGITAYLAGYFGRGGEYSAAGHGFFSANLLTWFDPLDWAGFLAQFGRDVAQGHEWSRLLPALGQATVGQYEGFAYLGAGMLLLVAIALFAGRRPNAADRPPTASWVWLLVVCAVLALLAVSARPALGTRILLEVPLPSPVQWLLGMFRASGRFIWPLTFLLMAWALARVARLLGGTGWLALGLLIQSYDLSAKLSELRDRFRVGPPGIAAVPTAPVWADALSACPRMQLLFWPGGGEAWITPALAAARSRSHLSPAPAARPSAQAEAQARADIDAYRAGRGWREDTLYVLPQGALAAVRAAPGFGQLDADGYVLFGAPRCLAADRGAAAWE